jgi:hypothetical protein
MSVAAMAWAKSRKAGSPSAKLVLLALADYADEHGYCWPSRATVAAECELSVRSVSDQFRALEREGLIKRDARARDNGSQTSNTIQLMIERHTPLQDLQGGEGRVEAPPLQDLQGRPAPFARAPLQDLQGAPASLAPPEPPLEPIELGTIVPVASAAPTATEIAPRKADPWTRDEEFAALWEASTPEMRRRSKSKAKVWPEWAKARRSAEPAVILLGLLAYLARDPDVGRTGGPGLHLWLKDRTWLNWTGDDGREAAPTWTDDQWATALDLWCRDSRWGDTLGPKPGEPGCRVPARLMIGSLTSGVAE